MSVNAGEQFLIKKIFEDRPDHPYYARMYSPPEWSGFIVWQELGRATLFDSREDAEQTAKVAAVPPYVVVAAGEEA